VINRDLNRRLIYECLCDERLKTKVERSTRLTYLFCSSVVDPRDDDYIRIKKTRSEEKKCHTKTMMSIIGDRSLK